MRELSKVDKETYKLATSLLDVVPLVNRAIRAEIRAHRSAELSVPQFRILGYVRQGSRVSLSDIAEHMGLTLPSMSKMVDGLCARGLLDRARDEDDRRKVSIVITSRGEEIWTAAWKSVCASMMQTLGRLDERKRQELLGALEALRSLFSQAADGAARTAGDRS